MERSLLRWYYRKSIEKLRYEGLHFMLWKAVTMLLHPFGNLGLTTFCWKDLARPLREIRAKVDIAVCQATEADIDQLTTLFVRRWGPKALQQRDIHREDFLQRFRRGAKCFVGKTGNEIIHYNWIFFNSLEPVTGLGHFIHLKDDEALCDDAFTEEAWRGKAIHTAVQYIMLRFLQQAGYRRVYTLVGTNNKSSQKAHRRLDWEFTGTMLYFIPRGAKKARIWRIKGTLDPFVTGENQRISRVG